MPEQPFERPAGRPPLTERQQQIQSAIGENLFRARLAQGLTQEEVADRLSVKYRYVASAEKGRVGISAVRAVEFAEALDIPISDLFKGL